ncbi:MAG: PIN domain-containing protein [Acidobacteria bacterium]|nr:PIN domain-containing protein [Acidobacteriota bacterium]
MAIAYLDSSCVVALAFAEPGSRRLAATLGRFERLLSSNLLEAEVRAAFVRERVAARTDVCAGLDWILPDRALTLEIDRVAALGGLRGADLWHVACALYLDPTAEDLAFVTLDVAQRRVAAAAGFATPH